MAPISPINMEAKFMKTRIVFGISFLIVISLICVSNAGAQRKETFVNKKDLPSAVRTTVQKQSETGRLRGLVKEEENGQVFYEAEIKVNGHTRDVLIDQNGQVVEIEEEINSASLPPIVKTSIEQNAKKWKVGKVESITKNGEIVAYEAHLRNGNQLKEIKVGTDGKLISTEITKVVVR